MVNEQQNNTRRRGDVLMDSIYEATTSLIREVGYANLTFQQIAQAAKTSRTVLYRRWATPFELIQAILVYKVSEAMGGDMMDLLEDTGSLRGDLLSLLKLYQRMYTEVGPEIMNAFLVEMGSRNEKIEDIRPRAIERNMLAMQKVLGFAQARGEKTKQVSDLTLTLPFDLIRIENMVHRDSIDTNRLQLLIEEVLLPVFKA